MAQFGGLYRATVIDSIDPAAGGRLQVAVPEVTEAKVWAERCSPLAPWRCESEPPSPAPGTPVWIMFEQGDPSFPVVVGVRHDPTRVRVG